ncbi:MAG: hypothetical protein BGO51_19860 [Rhodospirillales bacterium 69-11]|nr:MAG: hypothetical protein BGO51_19860 [Rhodospirillales bacterium 69-11]
MVAVQFVMSIAFGIVGPIMPLFLPELGVTTAAAINLWAGVLVSVTSFVAIFTAPVWGALADRYGRKLMVLRSCAGIGLFTALMGVAHDPWQMLALRAGMGALAGFNSAATVLVASQVPERRLGTALGWLSTGQLVGSLVGPVIGGALADLSGSYRNPFFFAGAICFLAFLGTLRFVPEHFVRAEVRTRTPLLQSIRLLTRGGGLLPVLVVMLMAQFATMAVQPVVTLFVREMLGDRPDLATLAGIAVSVTGLAGVLAVPILGRRGDTIGFRRVLLISLAGAALFTAPQGLPFGYAAFVGERFGLGLFVGSIVPAANALVGRLTPVGQRGLVFGLTSSAYFLGNTLGPLTGGAIAATAGIGWVFGVTAVLLAANLVWVWLKVPEAPAP